MVSFAFQIKTEIAQTFENSRELYILLGVALLTNGHFKERRTYFTTSHPDVSRLFGQSLHDDLGIRSVLKTGKASTSHIILPAKDRLTIRKFLNEEFGCQQQFGQLDPAWFNPDGCDVLGLEGEFVPPIRILQAFFLAGGSIQNPEKSYFVELWSRSERIAAQCAHCLAEYGIQVTPQKKGNYDILYLKEGNTVADFLALLGAHRARLDFETVRVQRELNNHVNRVVNCDTANSKRLAEAAARQHHLLMQLKQSDAWSELPDSLKKLADLRLDHPALSLRELGELCDPPLNKSSVNHRLKQIEKVALRHA